MTDVASLFKFRGKRLPERLTAERAKQIMELAGAEHVRVKVGATHSRFETPPLSILFVYFRTPCVWVLRSGAWDHNFARDVEREFKSANERAA